MASRTSYNTTVIIPMHNSEDTIVETLRGLENQTVKCFEVIVVDDGSTDASRKLVREFRKRTKLPLRLVCQKRYGPAKARNHGGKLSKGEKIIFLDSDCVTENNWVEEMVRPLGGNIVGCSCTCKARNGEKLVARYVDYEIAKRHEKAARGDDKIDAIGTYSAGFLRDVFVKAGGFDTEYTSANAEDFDFSFKLRKMGFRLAFTEKTCTYHHHPSSLVAYLRQQYARGYWRVKMYLRNTDRILKGDSYTGYEPQIQFVLSNLVFLSLPLAIVDPRLVALGLGVLFLSNLHMGVWTVKRERKFLLLAPLLASLRSLAGTLGVYTYVIKRIF